jgi:hypothetical protein
VVRATIPDFEDEPTVVDVALSSDGGRTWRVVRPGLPVWPRVAVNGDSVAIVSGERVQWSVDGGANFVEALAPAATAPFVVLGDRVLFAVEGGVSAVSAAGTTTSMFPRQYSTIPFDRSSVWTLPPEASLIEVDGSPEDVVAAVAAGLSSATRVLEYGKSSTWYELSPGAQLCWDAHAAYYSLVDETYAANDYDAGERVRLGVEALFALMGTTPGCSAIETRSGAPEDAYYVVFQTPEREIGLPSGGSLPFSSKVWVVAWRFPGETVTRIYAVGVPVQGAVSAGAGMQIGVQMWPETQCNTEVQIVAASLEAARAVPVGKAKRGSRSSDDRNQARRIPIMEGGAGVELGTSTFSSAIGEGGRSYQAMPLAMRTRVCALCMATLQRQFGLRGGELFGSTSAWGPAPRRRPSISGSRSRSGSPNGTRSASDVTCTLGFRRCGRTRALTMIRP